MPISSVHSWNTARWIILAAARAAHGNVARERWKQKRNDDCGRSCDLSLRFAERRKDGRAKSPASECTVYCSARTPAWLARQFLRSLFFQWFNQTAYQPAFIFFCFFFCLFFLSDLDCSLQCAQERERERSLSSRKVRRERIGKRVSFPASVSSLFSPKRKLALYSITANKLDGATLASAQVSLTFYSTHSWSNKKVLFLVLYSFTHSLIGH